jgi:hypothetical protein
LASGEHAPHRHQRHSGASTTLGQPSIHLKHTTTLLALRPPSALGEPSRKTSCEVGPVKNLRIWSTGGQPPADRWTCGSYRKAYTTDVQFPVAGKPQNRTASTPLRTVNNAPSPS